jgi:hypothetical protein
MLAGFSAPRRTFVGRERERRLLDGGWSVACRPGALRR